MTMVEQRPWRGQGKALMNGSENCMAGEHVSRRSSGKDGRTVSLQLKRRAPRY